MTKNFQFRRPRGFTLIEMLVAISVISLIAVIGIGSYIRSLRRGRDGARQGAMKTVQNAFEQYFVVNDRYPQNTTEGGSAFPSGLPRDPVNTSPYVYTFTYDTAAPVGETFCACARLEFAAGNSTNATCTYGTGSFFCVTNAQ